VVVQCDRLNQQIHNTLLAMITGNTRLVGVERTPFLIDPTTPEGASSGLCLPSAVKCENIATVPQQDIIDTVWGRERLRPLQLDRVPDQGIVSADRLPALFPIESGDADAENRC
jgi:hypothetical protein